MVPAVPLRHPDDLAAVVEIGAIFFPAVAEERLRLLVDNRPGRAGRGIDLDDPVDLVAALVVLEGEGPAVLAPGEAAELIGVGEERVVDLDPRLGVDRKEDRPLDVEDIAGLGIFHLVVLRLKLVRRRGLNVVDDAVGAPAQTRHDELL